MTFEIISSHPMNSGLVTEPVPMIIKRNAANIFTAAVIQIIWKNVAGSLDGKIDILASVDQDSFSLGRTITIELADNTNDPEMFVLNPVFEFIRIEYTPNSINEGELSCFINYREVV